MKRYSPTPRRKRISEQRTARKFRPRLNEAVDEEDAPRVYVGTYGLYNEGSLEGDWFNLMDYDSKKDFYKALAERFKGIDDDPEYMFQDWENCGDLVTEYGINDKLFDLISEYRSDDRGMDWDAYIQLAPEYDLDDIFMVVEKPRYGNDNEAIGRQYVDELGVSELGEDTIENYFDYEAFGRDLCMDFSVEEVNGKIYLFQ